MNYRLMNYRVEQIIQAGKGHPERFYGKPFLTEKEKIIFSLLNPLYFTKIKATGLAEGYGCYLDKENFEIEIITGERILNVEAALQYAEEILTEFRKEFEPVIDSPTILSNAIDLLRYDAYKQELYLVNKNLTNLPVIAEIKHKLNVTETFLVPTVQDMNNIQVKLKNDVIDLQSHLSKVAANLDYYSKDLKESIKFIYDRMDEDNKGQETLNYDYSSRLNGYDDWVENDLKSQLRVIDLVEQSYGNRIEELEKQILTLQTPWYAKLWNKLTIFWSNM